MRRDTTDWNLPATLVGATPYLLAARFLEPRSCRCLSRGGADPRLTMPNGADAVMLAAGMGSSQDGEPAGHRDDRLRQGRDRRAACEDGVAAAVRLRRRRQRREPGGRYRRARRGRARLRHRRPAPRGSRRQRQREERGVGSRRWRRRCSGPPPAEGEPRHPQAPIRWASSVRSRWRIRGTVTLLTETGRVGG